MWSSCDCTAEPLANDAGVFFVYFFSYAADRPRTATSSTIRMDKNLISTYVRCGWSSAQNDNATTRRGLRNRDVYRSERPIELNYNQVFRRNRPVDKLREQLGPSPLPLQHDSSICSRNFHSYFTNPKPMSVAFYVGRRKSLRTDVRNPMFATVRCRIVRPGGGEFCKCVSLNLFIPIRSFELPPIIARHTCRYRCNTFNYMSSTTNNGCI